MAVVNTLAYYDTANIMAVKSFKVEAFDVFEVNREIRLALLMGIKANM